MALLRRRPPARHRAIVASGANVDISDAKVIAAYRARRSRNAWQESAHFYNKEVPEVGFAHDYVRDSMSRVALVPAVLTDDPNALPVPLDEETVPDGLDLDLCISILDRLAPFPTYVGQTAYQLDIAGEAHIALLPDDDADDGERCRILSSQEVLLQGEQWKIKRNATDNEGLTIPADAPFFRIWQPDSEFSDEPTSHMRRLMGTCRILLALDQMEEGITRSRIAMGGRLLGIPDELSLESAVPQSSEEAGDGEARVDPFIEDFLLAAEAAILEPTSAAAALPLLLRGPADLLAKIVSIELARPFDDQMSARRTERREQVANGVNLPREVVLGIGGTNHWNAEEIRNQAWKIHLEPRALSICAATTEAFYRPQLRAAGVDPNIVQRCVVWYDPTWFIGTPDLSAEADNAYDRYEISGESYRRRKGFSENEAPDEDEVAHRLWIKQQERVTIRETAIAPPDVLEPAPAGPGDQPINEDSPDEAQLPDMVASAQPDRLARLGPKLVGIEADLRTRLQQVANGTVARALERAGLKVRNKLRQSDPRLAQIADIPAHEIIAALGEPAVRSLGLKEDALLTGALGDLEGQYHKFVRRAQHAAAQAAASATDRPVDERDLDIAMADSRDAGWEHLAAGITALAVGLLYNPHPTAPSTGEFDDTSIVPVGLIRSALDLAGGAPPDTTVSPSSDVSDGATAGPGMLDQFKEQLGIVSDTYTWVYGDAPRRTFEPHLNLDGTVFASFEDDVLANGDNFPDTDFYAPGDHDGCLCDIAVAFTQAAEEETQ